MTEHRTIQWEGRDIRLSLRMDTFKMSPSPVDGWSKKPVVPVEKMRGSEKNMRPEGDR